MRYGDFLTEYDRVHDAWAYGSMPPAAVAGEIARLRSLIPSIDEPDRHEWAEDLLTGWQSEVAGPHAERMGRAFEVLVRAKRPGGTPEERLARYRQGIDDIVDIADETDDSGEQAAILAYNELLFSLIDGVEHPAEQ